ncbi:MAG: thermosome subunit beta [Candidatus Hadarchaeales archaeon]
MVAESAVPVLILPERTARYVGRTAQQMNILAARVVAEAIRTTLGPRGMDKMLVDSMGDVTITNDGATILKEMDVEHPAAKMMVEISKAQDNEVGDGTTTAVVLAGELLKRAEDLLGQNIHTTSIIAGYRQAAQRAMEVLSRIAVPISKEEKDKLRLVALTSLSGKGIGDYEKFADVCVEAILQVAEERDGKIKALVDNVKVDKRIGGSAIDTQLVKGLVLDKEVVHPGMPKRITDAKIALLNCALEIEQTETKAKINIESPEQIKAFLDEEQRLLKEMVEEIKRAGANVVICQKGIDDVAQHFLAKAGILAVRRVKESDMEKLARATGGKIVTSVKELTPADLGFAQLVEERKVSGEKMVFIEGCKNPKSVSILVRGGAEHVVDEAERAIHDALCVLSVALEEGKILGGGGAPELEVAKELRNLAESVGGKEALAINAFADSMEVIPQTLAENAGLDPVDILTQLRAEHGKPNSQFIGLDAQSGKIVNTLEMGIIEPLKVKTQAIKSASEAAEMILRIDDVIAAGKLEKEKEKEEGKKPSTPE